ncbi:hypothetical protein ABK040_000052 [Willaertia magna]
MSNSTIQIINNNTSSAVVLYNSYLPTSSYSSYNNNSTHLNHDYWEHFSYYGYLVLIHPIIPLFLKESVPEVLHFLGFLLSRIVFYGIILIEGDGFFILYCIHKGFVTTNPKAFTIYLFCIVIKRLYFNYKNFLMSKLIYQNGYIQGARESVNLIHVNDFQLLDYSQTQLTERYNYIQLKYIKKKVLEFLDTISKLLPNNDSVNMNSNELRINSEKINGLEEDENPLRDEELDMSTVIASHKCCICFDETVNILFNPCRHLAICQECYESYLSEKLEQDKNLKCILCNSNVSSIDYAPKKRYVQNRISVDDYHQLGSLNTQRELMKLALYVNNNSEIKQRLLDPTIFDRDDLYQ